MPRTEMPANARLNRGKRVRDIRERLLGISRPKFAEQYGIAKNTLRNWELGENSGLTADGAKQLCKAFAKAGIMVTEEWLMQGGGNVPIENIPSLPNLPPLTEATCIKELLLGFHQKYPHAVDVIVEGDELSPYINVGEHVLGVRYYANELEKALNKLCIVHTTDKKTYLGYLRYAKGKGYQLQAELNDHPKTDLTLDIFSAAPILAILRNPKQGT